ncbi:chemotaxis protein methyltransferase CheR [Herbaspirillum sp. Sphag1AN]|uniref:CheR family methyltransferase n=1 Tax=unclassified Herbaspirillum TaxID=2624150 RepID=UPI0016165063|nr:MULTISPECIES: CheR family methyltransferase [unclassified Herbaspirillum]MBB3211048.1 chemotaxis protein methyltransferase CheR [Herbaspirillum sp. Sphag1AN]MBB3244677.1 chemotaxis protein methyltransferase CheR [Herbaspirillum sp. Sphag64]
MKTSSAEKSDSVKEFDFTHRDFERVRDLIYRRAGIALADSKQEMVYSRLARRLRATGIGSFVQYLDLLERGGDADEWEAFTNALTTNLTSFFRESHHFPILGDFVKTLKEPVTVWCSASSTGEEPYSIAMTLCEAYGSLTPPAQIVATDIDTNVLATGANGVYPLERIEKMAPERVKKFFLRGKGAQEGFVRVRPELRKMVTFKQLNLLGDGWPVSGPFDVIFCRNVMIYFDKPTQSKILSRFVPLMKPHALLFAGHSENFLYVSDSLKLKGKTVYELNEAAQRKAGK